MTQGTQSSQTELLDLLVRQCQTLSPTSLYRLLHERGDELFPDSLFCDLFSDVGRASAPPRVLASVMILQRANGMSDREAMDHLLFDMRWKFACQMPLDSGSYAHTVLVNLRARLAKSKAPDRIFEAVKQLAQDAGLIGRKRVLDSTALYDAVATQDTATMVHDAIRLVLKELSDSSKHPLEQAFARKGDYKDAGKPACNWDDKEARAKIIDDLANDGNKVLNALENKEMSKPLRQAVELLATVIGQDLQAGADGKFTIIRGVAADRVISTVDPETRHGHKTESRHFDGFKGHVAIDPDSEIITAIDVTAGNVGDASAVVSLLKEELAAAEKTGCLAPPETKLEVYGDASYGTADVLEQLEEVGFEANLKVQAPSNRKELFTQDQFTIDLENKTVCCPEKQLVRLKVMSTGDGSAEFGALCEECPKRSQCTESKTGRTIRIHRKYKLISRYRAHQKSDDWKLKYRSTRPKIERKIAHLMRHRHGGRRARVRGCQRVRSDFATLAAAVNLARIAKIWGKVAAQ